MGAVVAFLSRDRPAAAEIAGRMGRAAPHRGSDVRTLEFGRAVLGVCAGDGVGTTDLRVQDGLAAAFCGSLDNLADLGRDLRTEGFEPPRDSPAAVIAAAFGAWGTDAAARLRGAFSAVVTDGGRLWGLRDHVGFRALFCREAPDGVHVATEAKQVVAGAGIPPRPDRETLELIFYGRMDGGAEHRCALAGVERLPPGFLLEAGETDCSRRRYWHPESLLETVRISRTEVEERFHALMERAVARCLAGDDVVSLSGGVDSPAVAAYAAPIYRERTGRRLPALSTVFPEYPSVDETPYVEGVARELDLELHTFVPTGRPIDGLERWVRLFDGPVPVISLSEEHEYLERARALGFRNVLRGDIAEFVFDFRRHALTHFVAYGRLGPAIRHLRARRRAGASAGALAEEVAKALLPVSVRGMYRRLRGSATPARLPDWLDPDMANSPPLRSGRDLWREDQLVSFRGPGLSFEADDAIQAVTGVSVRRPFADVDLWEFFLSLPAELKFPTPERKGLVRSMLRGRVPDLVLDRQDKTVFDAFIHGRVDYGALRGWILEADGYRMPGVDYELLGRELRDESLDLTGFMWAKDLAAVHAFMAQW